MIVNGKELRITPSSLVEALNLQKAVGKAIKSEKLNIDIKFNPTDLSKSEVGDNTIGSLLSAVLSVATSDEVMDALFVCSERAVLGTDKINRDFFEDVANREYFYPIMIEILKVNVGPFLKGLLSGFSAVQNLVGNFQK